MQEALRRDEEYDPEEVGEADGPIGTDCGSRISNREREGVELIGFDEVPPSGIGDHESRITNCKAQFELRDSGFKIRDSCHLEWQDWVALARQPEIAAIEFCYQIVGFLKGILSDRVMWSRQYRGWLYYPRFFQVTRPGWHKRILELWKEYPDIMRAFRLEIVSEETLLWTPKTNPYPHARKF